MPYRRLLLVVAKQDDYRESAVIISGMVESVGGTAHRAVWVLRYDSKQLFARCQSFTDMT